MSQYATPADLAATGLPAAALDVDSLKQIEFLQLASATIDTYMRSRYRLPITGELDPANTFPHELRDACVSIAAWRLMSYRGVGVDGGEDNFKARHDFYLGAPGMKGWLDKLSAGAVSINAALDASPTSYDGAAVVAQGSRRGWDDSNPSTQLGELESSFWRRDI